MDASREDGNLIGVYQQDRYSNGGSKGTTATIGQNGGATWTDSPNGNAHVMSLVTDPDPVTGGFEANGMVDNRSTNGGPKWEPPIMLLAGRFWRTRSQLELAIVEFAASFNTTRLHGARGDRPPAGFEALHAARIPALRDPQK